MYSKIIKPEPEEEVGDKVSEQPTSAKCLLKIKSPYFIECVISTRSSCPNNGPLQKRNMAADKTLRGPGQWRGGGGGKIQELGDEGIVHV